MGPFIESCLSLIHGDGVETDTAGLNVFNRWSSPLEQAGNVINSATGIPAQGYSWGVLTDIWFNLTINVGIFAMSLPMNPLMTEGSRPVRKGSVDYRQMKPAITAAKYGPLLKTSEKWNYLNQGELYEFEDSELWNIRLMYMDFNLGCDTEDITEVIFIDRLPAATLPGDRQRTIVESGLTPAHAVCTIKLPIYNNVSGKLLIPTTVLATANSIVSGIIPPNVVMFITRHVPAQSAYIGPEKDNFMNKLAQKLKGGSSSSKEQSVGDLSKEPIIAISSTS